ncbi:Putative ribonuclease H protein At1g65750 [Linum perenne]
MVSLEKSRVYFSKNTTSPVRRSTCRLLGIAETQDLGRYLGVPVLHGRISKNTYEYIIERIDQKLDGWKRNSLSLAGRVTLATSVLNALPSYAMQTSTLPASILKSIDSRIRSFVWGGSKDERKIHLVSWDVVCRPTSQGGLRLRKAKELNEAFLMKLGWHILKHPEKLWVRVMTSKYLKEVDEVISIRRKNWGSALWRGIRRVWPTLRNSCQKSIRDGKSTSFWFDAWLDSGITLADFSTKDLDEDEKDRLVAEATDDNGDWDWRFLSNYLPPQCILQVAGMQSPKLESGEDDLIWGPDQNGQFSIKSAYEVLATTRTKENGLLWKTVWNWSGPNHVRFFLWLTAHNRLLTNGERKRRHLADDDLCNHCKSAPEDALHVLRECPFARKLWISILPPDHLPTFFTGNLHDWLLRELKDKELGQLVGITSWLLWKARNEAIFEKVFVTSDQLRLRVLHWIAGVRETMKAQLLNLSNVVVRSRDTLISWIPPPDDWFKINTDGSVTQPHSSAAAGGVIRDCQGRSVAAFTANLGSCSIMRAELRAAELGLAHAWELGAKKVILELDSRAAVLAIDDKSSWDSRHGPILLRIHHLRSRDWQVIVRHCYREANRVADLLAHLGHCNTLGVHLLDFLPPPVRSALFSDCTGVSFPRIIPINR